MSSLHSDLFTAGFHQACGRGDPAQENLPATGLRQVVSPQGGLQGAVAFIFLFLYIFCGLECVGHSFA